MTAQLFEPDLTHSVIGAFYEVYNHLGFGFLEHLYVMALERELRARGHQVGREVGVRVMYKGEELGIQRLDMIVDEKLVVEVKATPTLHKDAGRQVTTTCGHPTSKLASSCTSVGKRGSPCRFARPPRS